MVFSDAAFGNLKNGGSQGGHLIFLVGENNKCNLLGWQSKKLKRVVRSTLAAETLALLDAIDHAIYISSLYQDLFYGSHTQVLPIEAIIDNDSLYQSLQSTKHVTERRLRVDIGALKEQLMGDPQNIINWVGTKQQLADCLTKQGVSTVLLSLVIDKGQLPL